MIGTTLTKAKRAYAKYRITEHSEPFPGFDDNCLFGIEERVGKTNNYTVLYEAMLTREQAERALIALPKADRQKFKDDDLALFLDSEIFAQE